MRVLEDHLLEASGRRVVFSGDLGLPAHLLLVAPASPPASDVLVP